MVASVEEGSSDPINFRYQVAPKPRVSVFTPKSLPDGTDVTVPMRATWLGAVARTSLTKLPKSMMGAILWEALFT